MRTARRLLALVLGLALTSIAAAYEPTPLFRRYEGLIEQNMTQRRAAIRSGALDRFTAQYWEDAVRIVIEPSGARQRIEGREAITEHQAQMIRGMSYQERTRLPQVEGGDLQLEGLPEHDLPAYVFIRPDFAQVLQYSIRRGVVRIERELIVFFVSEPYRAAGFAEAIGDGDRNHMIDQGEQILLTEWLMGLTGGPHRQGNPLDSYFDWDENRRIDESESVRAGLILYRDQLRFSARALEPFVAEYVTRDDSSYVSLFEAQQAYVLARGEVGEIPRPTDEFTERVDLDMDGWFTPYEREIFARLLSGSIIRVSDIPRMNPNIPNTAEAVFHYADVDQNGRLSEPELYDIGLIARQILTDTELVTNPLERRYDQDHDLFLSRREREAALDELVSVLLPQALQYADMGIDRWVQLGRLDQNGNGRIDESEINLVQVSAINPSALFNRRPSSPIEESMDTDPTDGILEPHEVFGFIDGVFATVIQIWIQMNTDVAGEILDTPERGFIATANYGTRQDRSVESTTSEDNSSTPSGDTTSSRSTGTASPETTSNATPAATDGTATTSGGASTSASTSEDLVDSLSITVNLDPFFPVLYEYHAEEPIGTVTLINTGTTTLRDVYAEVSTQRFMDWPLSGEVVQQVAPGEEATLNLRALFNSDILDITEGTRIVAAVTVKYQSENGAGEIQRSEPMRIHDRNAIVWDDDRKVAAYVTSRNPEFLSLAADIALSIEDDRITSISQNFQEAMALFEALAERGIAYRVDPSSSYSELSGGTTVDYVRYPYQTWDNRVGDCDDLSVLYVTLLESAGIPSAFVTTPGHIFAAFQLDVPPDRVSNQFSDTDLLIIDDEGEFWVPVEVTLIDDGFVNAWLSAASTYQQYTATGDADLIITSDAWQVFDPVQSPFDDDLDTIDETNVVASFMTDLDTFRNREISVRRSAWQQQIDDTSTSASSRVRLQNRLGWLYANYGMMDDARTEFETILETTEYGPTLVNLGNICYLEGDYDSAATYYDRALDLNEEYVPALLGMARSSYELGDYEDATAYFESVQEQDPTIAASYSYLRVSTTARASSASSVQTQVEWVIDDDDE